MRIRYCALHYHFLILADLHEFGTREYEVGVKSYPLDIEVAEFDRDDESFP